MQLLISNKPKPAPLKTHTQKVFEPRARDRPESPTALPPLRRQGGSAWPPARQKQQQQQKKKQQQQQNHHQQEKSALNRSGACDTSKSRWRPPPSTNGTGKCTPKCSCTLIHCSRCPCRAGNGCRRSAIREGGWWRGPKPSSRSLASCTTRTRAASWRGDASVHDRPTCSSARDSRTRIVTAAAAALMPPARAVPWRCWTYAPSPNEITRR